MFVAHINPHWVIDSWTVKKMPDCWKCWAVNQTLCGLQEKPSQSFIIWFPLNWIIIHKLALYFIGQYLKLEMETINSSGKYLLIHSSFTTSLCKEMEPLPADREMELLPPEHFQSYGVSSPHVYFQATLMKQEQWCAGTVWATEFHLIRLISIIIWRLKNYVHSSYFLW